MVESAKGQNVHEFKEKSRNCYAADGYSLHANRTVAAKDRQGLEQLCKYLCRPAVPAERLELVDTSSQFLGPVGNRTIRARPKLV